MYAAGLVPAAHIHFGCKSAVDGPVLKDNVLQQLGPAAARQVRSHVQIGDAEQANISQEVGGAAQNGGAGLPRQVGSQASGQAKKPKWLKIGK